MKTIKIQIRHSSITLMGDKTFIHKDPGSLKVGDTVLISDTFTIEQKDGQTAKQAREAFKAGKLNAISADRQTMTVTGIGQPFDRGDSEVCRFYGTTSTASI